MRALQRLWQEALADIGQEMPLADDVPVFAAQIVGRLAGPDRQHLIDAFQEHGVAVGIEIAEHLRVRQQAARRNAEDEPAVEQMIEHRDFGRHRAPDGCSAC